MSSWHVVNTAPYQERRAESNLRRQGYRVWLPSLRRSRRHARRIDTIAAPLFPGYLFVELGTEETWSPINGTFGVRRILCDGERPLPLPTEFVQDLRRTIDGEGFVAVPETLTQGQKVRLIAGPFVGCAGTLLGLAARDRVSILLRVLGHEVATVVPRRAVIAAA